MVQFTKPFTPNKIPIEYKLTEGGSNFIVPDPGIQMSIQEVHKAESYGIYISGPDQLIIEPEELANGQYRFNLGMDLKLPERYAMLHQGLIEGSVDYIVDSTSVNEWYRLYLYSNSNEVLFRPKDAVLKIIPILDIEYSFVYKKRFEESNNETRS